MTPSDCPATDELDQLEETIATAAACIDTHVHRLLTALRRFDQKEGWHRQGAKSCAEWLSWRTGMDPGAAREKVRVAKRLGELPALDAALASGDISYSKARAVSRVATAENAALLLEYAKAGTAAQLERICRGYRRAVEVTSPEQDEERTWVRVRDADDGMVRVELCLRPEDAALVMQAIDASRPEPSASRAEAVVAMAESVLRGGGDAESGASRPACEVTLHVDASTLAGTLEDGRAVSAETSRRLACDASVVTMTHAEDGSVLSVGRRRRLVTPRIRRALEARDRGCAWPGCTRKQCDAHHVVHWLDGGETSAAGMCLVCRTHHRYLHEYGFRVAFGDDGRPEFFDPSGRRIAAAPAPPDRGAVAMAAAQAPVRHGLPQWDGLPLDSEYAVDGLLSLSGADG